MKLIKEKKSVLLIIILLGMTLGIALFFKKGVALTLMVFFTAITGIYLLLKYLNQKYPNKWTRWGYKIFRIVLVSIGSLSILILSLVTYPQFSCQTIPPESKQAEVMIVLGAGLWFGDELSYSLRTRLEKTLEVFKANPHLKIIVSGGQGKDETITEAEAMETYLLKHGVPQKQIIKEDQARSTYENLLFSKEKIQNKEVPVILLSSNFHMFRSKFIAQSLGLEPIGICSPVYLSLKVNYMIREIPAVVNDFFGNVLK